MPINAVVFDYGNVLNEPPPVVQYQALARLAGINEAEFLIEWVQVLRKQGRETAILSNMPREISAHLRRTAAWLRLFDHLVFSGEHGHVKPEADLYRVCLKGLKAQPGEVLFFDDREDNVEGAREAGMHAVKFESIPQLMRDVEPYGLRPSLEEASRTVATRPAPGGFASTEEGLGA